MFSERKCCRISYLKLFALWPSTHIVHRSAIFYKLGKPLFFYIKILADLIIPNSPFYFNTILFQLNTITHVCVYIQYLIILYWFMCFNHGTSGRIRI